MNKLETHMASLDPVITAGSVLAAGLAGGGFGVWRLSSSVLRLYQTGLRTKSSLIAAERLGGIGTWTINVHDQSLYWSPRVFTIHKRDRSLGVPDLQKGIEYYHPEDRILVTNAVEMALRHGDDFEFKARIICDDGSQKHVASRGMCETDAAGEVVTVYGIFIEIAHVMNLARSINDNPDIGKAPASLSAVKDECNKKGRLEGRDGPV